MNNQTFRANYNDPLLLKAHEGNLTFEPDRVVYNFGNSKSIRIVLNNKYVAVHPMHMHGHNMVSLFFNLVSPPYPVSSLLTLGMRSTSYPKAPDHGTAKPSSTRTTPNVAMSNSCAD